MLQLNLLHVMAMIITGFILLAPGETN